MEAVEAFLDGEWDSLSKLFSSEDSDLLLHCNGTGFFPFDVESPLNLSHGNSNNLDHSSFNDNAFDESMCRSSMFHDGLMEELLQLKSQAPCNYQPGDGPKASDDSCKEMQLKKRDDEGHISSQSSKKRPRVAREVHGKARKEAETKKARKGAKISYNDGMSNDGVVKQSSSSCSSERDDFDASETSESKGSTPTKIKDGKSPASDPQSLYARKRREKINERLRILQNLVPNGTKVDISTMLEEAVQYVKFLQLQIKLLSSDDTWMYAPIAYNGMDMGLYQSMIPNL